MALWVPLQRDVVDSMPDRTWIGYARWVSLGALTRCLGIGSVTTRSNELDWIFHA